MKTVHLKITGRVQGVWYRAWTRETALSLGLAGWVRNRLDGSVEAVVQGDETAVDQLIKKCWDGPTAARVDLVEVSDTDEKVKTGFAQEKTV
ncbi:MAG: acylphosphatase [Methylocystaceae bacterium]|nr:acylphosphatase [Methylocystaceae bacterium]